MFKSKKGFTLIELLVVIAIIGILSSVVLASLNTARTRGQDAKVKSEMSGLRAAAELYYDAQNPVSYSALFVGNNTCDSANAQVDQYITSIAAAATAEECNSAAGAYAVAVTLPGTTFWCIDSTGVSRGSTAAGVTYNALLGAAPAAIVDNATACN